MNNIKAAKEKREAQGALSPRPISCSAVFSQFAWLNDAPVLEYHSGRTIYLRIDRTINNQQKEPRTGLVRFFCYNTYYDTQRKGTTVFFR